MNTILVPVSCVNVAGQNTVPAVTNVTAHIPPTGMIRNGGTLLKTLENIWFIFKKEGYFCAGNDYLARKLKAAESTIGRALSRLQELGAVQIVLYPGLLREIKPLVSVAELRTLMSGLMRSFLRSVPPNLLSPESDVSEIATNKPNAETVTEPMVSCSLASQKEKDNGLLPKPETVLPRLPEQDPKAESRPERAANTQSENVPNRSVLPKTPRGNTPVGGSEPLDLPAAAAPLHKCAQYLVIEGKITEGFAASVLADVPAEILLPAIEATKEREAKGGLRSVAGFLRTAIANRWKPNGSNPSPNTPNTHSDDPRAVPERFRGYANIAEEWERAMGRHLKAIPLERYRDLMARAMRKLEEKPFRYSPGTLCEYMAIAHGFDMEGAK